MKQFKADSQLFSGNAAFVEGLYEDYLTDRKSVEPHWIEYFDQLTSTSTSKTKEVLHSQIRDYFLKSAKTPKVELPTAATPSTAASSQAVDVQELQKQDAVIQLINEYRLRGHMMASLDPLQLHEKPRVPTLEPGHFGLTADDFDKVYSAGNFVGLKTATLRQIIHTVEQTYCGSIGAEFAYIGDSEEVEWIQTRLEESHTEPQFTTEDKLQILKALTAAEALERYLHTKYVGQKRFSLEGGDGLIPVMDALIQRAGGVGTKEVVIGMAHRGRLNVLVNILGKLPQDLFSEFEGTKYQVNKGSGDVKYHMGFSSHVESPGGPIHLTLAFNPSHLEIIDPVVEGSVRARQELYDDAERSSVVPILVHGDAAFIGQGVVMETLNLSQVSGFTTGGTVHVVVNNQIGFTTSNLRDSRSTLYCTDIAKMVQAPIFHVNGDDPEALVFVSQLAMDFRMRFKKDVVIDIICYRRHGHNEADEPAMTQPVMYKKIRNHPRGRELYAQELKTQGVIAGDDDQAMLDAYRDKLIAGEEVSLAKQNKQTLSALEARWAPYLTNTTWRAPADTTIDRALLSRLASALLNVPDHIKPHRRVVKIMHERVEMANGERPIDWGFAETMAYATLLNNGYPIRLVGQDSGRGTFSHRHAVIHNTSEEESAEKRYVNLQHISENQPRFLVIDSTLSEEAVLGFEFGYSQSNPDTLVIWEAQFGDFANGAQVVIDQFISSSESKWGRNSGIVLFLPHGYEGQGPEHSSARVERYLQLCAEQNMQVCSPTTPAQMYHMLRRQMLRAYRKPLIVMTPKSLLRHKLSVSTVDDLVDGSFLPLIPEIDEVDPQQVTRVLLCSGKVYFDLLQARRDHNLTNVAIIRIEQLYPFPTEELEEQLKLYASATEVVWVQEEPKNQGAWYQCRHRFVECLLPEQSIRYAGRPRSASPAVGSLGIHNKQQQKLVEEALGIYNEQLE